MSPSSTKKSVHRPGALKQQNKRFKTGRHRSEHEIKRSAKGRVAENKHQRSLKRLNVVTKANRSNKSLQLRKQKLISTQQTRQTIGSLDGVHQIITLISLSSNINLFSVVELLTKCLDDQRSTDVPTDCGARIYTSPKLRAKFCFLTPNSSNFENVLDAAQLSDTIVYLVSSEKGISIEGDYLLDLIDHHCSPSSVIYCLQTSTNDDQMSHLTSTTKNSTNKLLEKFLQKRSPDAKFVPFNSEQDAQRLLRKFTELKLIQHGKKTLRPFLFAESFSYENSQGSTGTLKLSGYLRGVDLSVNDLVYLPTLGYFQMEKIEEIRFQRNSNGTMEEIVDRTLIADPSAQKSLDFEAERDPMNDNEQTWPTNEEIQQAQQEQHRIKKRVPKGTSEYQAAWILSDDEDEEIEGEEEDEDEDEQQQMNVDDDENDQDRGEEEEEEMDELVINTNKYDENLDVEEDQQTLKKMKEAKLDAEFPDEVDTPMDVPARVRFQKYRGLKSFRTTKWDPKENLPEDYSRIYQFPNFRSMIKQIQFEQEQKLQHHHNDSAHLHRFVNIYLKNVPFHRFEPGHHLFLIGLLPHEQCLSVLNIVLTRPNDSQTILKSKEPLLFIVGHRRFISSPIFSQHTRGNKHKFERFFRPGETLVATCFAPITYPPSSVLAFKQHSDGREELIGTGSVLSVNPDRIILKRIVLSGHPLKIHKTNAVVRYMFFNPDDVNWFKPIELRTRWGRRGHIKESLGTHGHMKCQFDGYVKSQDTIFMNLYKRIYPKWTYRSLTLDEKKDERATME